MSALISSRLKKRCEAMRGDAGISLVELLIVMILLSIFLTVVSSLYISSLNTVTMGRNVVGNSKQASNAMNEISRVVRSGVELNTGTVGAEAAIVSASKEKIRLYTNINFTSNEQKPMMVEFERTSNGNLVERQWKTRPAGADGYWVVDSTPSMTQVLASTLTGTEPNFTFYDKDGAAVDVAGLSGNDLKQIVAVDVRITVKPSANDDRNPVTLQNLVRLPNLGFAKEKIS